jgi:hypothetical protein
MTFNETYCITAAGVPHRLTQEFTTDNAVFLDVNFTHFIAGEPDASLFGILSFSFFAFFPFF